MSSALSRIFLCLFVLTLLPAAASITSQVLQKPLRINIGSGSSITIGEPGIVVNARKNSSAEYPAPDTMVTLNVVIANPASGNIENGRREVFHLNPSPDWDTKAILDSSIAREKRIGNVIQLDTSMVIMRHQTWNMNEESSTASFDSLQDGRVVYLKKSYGINGAKLLPEVRDTCANMREAFIRSITGTRKEPVVIREDPTSSTNQLRLLPTGTGQRIAFAIYQALYASGIALLFFLVSRLFRNFAKEEYFTLPNVKLLRNLGACMLTIQLIKIFFYFLFLVKIHPVKISASAADKTVSRLYQYEILSGVEPQDLFVGMGVLVLSYIFLNGLKLKQENSLTI